MKKILCLIIVLLILNIVIAQESKVYTINLNYKGDQLTLRDISIQRGVYPDRRIQPQNGYMYELLSFDNQALDAFRFDIPITIQGSLLVQDNSPQDIEQSFEQPVKKLEQTDFALITKYFPNAKQINIYDPNNIKVLEIDVSRFSTQKPIQTITTPQQILPSSQQPQIPEQYQDLTEEEILAQLQQQDLSPEEKKLLLQLIEEEKPRFPIEFALIIGIAIILGIIFYIIMKKRQKPKFPSQPY